MGLSTNRHSQSARSQESGVNLSDSQLTNSSTFTARPIAEGQREAPAEHGNREIVDWSLHRSESGLSLVVNAKTIVAGLVGGIGQALDTLREYFTPRTALTTAVAVAAVEAGFSPQSQGSLIVAGQNQAQVDAGADMAEAGKVLSLKVLVPGVGVGYRNGTATPFIGPDGTGYAFISKHVYSDLLAYDPHPSFEVATGSNYMTDRGTVFTATSLVADPTYDFAILTLGPNTLQGSPTTITSLSVGSNVYVGGFGDSAYIGDSSLFRDGNARGYKMRVINPLFPGETLLSIDEELGVDANGFAPGKGLNGDSDSGVYDQFGRLGAMLINESGGTSGGLNGAVDLQFVMDTIETRTGYSSVPEPASIVVGGLLLAGTLMKRHRSTPSKGQTD